MTSRLGICAPVLALALTTGGARAQTPPATAGMELPADVVLSADTPLPGGIVLPAGTFLPAGTVLPPGTILPLKTPTAEAPADEESVGESVGEPAGETAPAPAAVPETVSEESAPGDVSAPVPAPVMREVAPQSVPVKSAPALPEPSLSSPAEAVLPKLKLNRQPLPVVKPVLPVAVETPPAPVAPIEPAPAATVEVETAEPTESADSAPPDTSTENQSPADGGDGAAVGVPYVSGGIGASEREEMAQVKTDYNVHLHFAEQSGSYLADVRVKIFDAAGTTLVAAGSKGPWFYTRLVPGRYRVVVENAGREQTRELRVTANGAVQVTFYWPPVERAR